MQGEQRATKLSKLRSSVSSHDNKKSKVDVCFLDKAKLAHCCQEKTEGNNRLLGEIDESSMFNYVYYIVS